MSIVFFLLALSLLVIFHELGHYFAARLFGIKADEFGFGFPPRMFGFVKVDGTWKFVGRNDEKTYKNTIWSFNWLPLGGFVRIKGEEQKGQKDTDAITQKPIWQRLVVVSAGVFMNWVVAAVLFAGVFFFGTQAVLEDLPAGAHIEKKSVTLTGVLAKSPADIAGFQIGDTIVSVDGASVVSADDARLKIGVHHADPVTIGISRHDVPQMIVVTPAYLADYKKNGVGIAISNVGLVTFGFFSSIWNGARMATLMCVEIVTSLGTVITNLVMHGKVADDLSGPVGIAVVAGKIAQQGVTPFLQFAAMLSANLAVINFLPIPALDGGRALFLIIEKIRRKPMERKLEIGIHNTAFLLLILMILLVTIRDVKRLF